MRKLRTRKELHRFLCDEILLSSHAYFQPPPTVKLVYPCIIYSLSRRPDLNANDALYVGHRSYTLIVVDYDPDSAIADRLNAVEYCSFDRSYVSDNLNHFVYTITI